MRMQHDQFETVLPKTERFFTPPTSPPPVKIQPKSKIPVWAMLLIGGLAGGLLATSFNHPAAPVTAPVVAPTPPPLPDVRHAAPTLQVEAAVAPRAQIVHIRPIGTSENDRMPDGRILNTTYRGELKSVTGLPTTGAQMGDMWFTRNDGHCWVLAPVTTGSQTTGWVDP